MKLQKAVTALLLVTLTLIAGTSFAAEEKGKLINTIQKRGVLRVGMDIFKPWAMKDSTGELVGFEIDVARKLGSDMGVKVEFMPTAWDGIIPALLTRRFDVVIGGMGITEKRQRKVDFTTPYDNGGQAIVANKKKAEGMNTLEAFNTPGVEIAVKLGTTAADAAKKTFPKATLRYFDTEPAAYQELRNGKVAAVVSQAPKPAFEAIDYSDILFTPVAGTFTKEPIGMALRKGDTTSLAFFNNWIKTNDQWLKERHHYWFETRDWVTDELR
ncbi:MAG: transporter substrate-binding domain-containing protein [Desulforhopalus sp.]|nr:transporter substrate-binding domain-containing protein [Desulforhopalus sp.]